MQYSLRIVNSLPINAVEDNPIPTLLEDIHAQIILFQCTLNKLRHALSTVSQIYDIMKAQTAWIDKGNVLLTNIKDKQILVQEFLDMSSKIEEHFSSMQKYKEDMMTLLKAKDVLMKKEISCMKTKGLPKLVSDLNASLKRVCEEYQTLHSNFDKIKTALRVFAETCQNLQIVLKEKPRVRESYSIIFVVKDFCGVNFDLNVNKISHPHRSRKSISG